MILAAMKLFRIASMSFPIFDGTGARLHGARWNSPGRSVIYCSSSLACCRLEILAHAGTRCAPVSHGWISIDVPAMEPIQEVDPGALPIGWDAVPDNRSARKIGDGWHDAGKTLLLKVPSKGDFNVLINQSHPGFAGLVATAPQAVDWDGRLFR
jgi:RES domain-containing protein